MQLTEDELDEFVCGKCIDLAASIHRLTGWPIEAVLEPANEHYPETVFHAWCRNPVTRECVDIDGAYSDNENGWYMDAYRHVTGQDEAGLMALVRINRPNLAHEEWNADVEKALPVARDYVLPLIGVTPK